MCLLKYTKILCHGPHTLNLTQKLNTKKSFKKAQGPAYAPVARGHDLLMLVTIAAGLLLSDYDLLNTWSWLRDERLSFRHTYE